MMAGDWLRLHRKSLESRVFSDEWLWRLWCWCLMSANWKTSWNFGREILPGQFTLGRIEAAERLSVSPSRLYRGLHTLSEWGQIRLEANNRFTVVTICNWRAYQPEDSDERTSSEHPVNNQRTASEQPADTLIRKKERKTNTFAADKPPRPRDELFDSVVEVTGADPKVNGSHIGRVCKALRSADPPYTPADIHRLPAAIAAAGLDFAVTVAVVEKWIYLVRASPTRPGTTGQAASTQERIDKAQRDLEARRRQDREGALNGEAIREKLRQATGRKDI